jgi:nitrite reductase/ring-hydroxylating ferredoxin subunit
MARYPKPAEGSWTEHYGLGTGTVSYGRTTSAAHHELEKEAIFKRAWLHVGRVEQIPRVGSYFTKEIPAADTSIIVVRDKDDTIRAFHNICRHRGNKLVWNDYPQEETAGTCRQFTCKYHAWRYDLDGSLAFVQQEQEFFDLDKSQFGLVPVHVDTWLGFVFVNFAKEPEWTLPEFLGPMVRGIEGYPMEKMTERRVYRTEVKSNWKLFADAAQEFYHAPVLHQKQNLPALATPMLETGFEAPYYQIDGPHRLISTGGIRFWEFPEDQRKPIDALIRSGLFGQWDAPDLGELPAGVNPGGIEPWGVQSYQIFPNFLLAFWSQNWAMSYTYWPTSHNTHVFEGTLHFVPPKTASEYLQHDLAGVTFKEYLLQDANTLEATQSMVDSGVVTEFPLGDQEVLCRALEEEVDKWIAEYQKEAW